MLKSVRENIEKKQKQVLQVWIISTKYLINSSTTYGRLVISKRVTTVTLSHFHTLTLSHFHMLTLSLTVLIST